MSVKKWEGRTRTELIIEVWEQLDCESVGARELEAIQATLQEKLGPGGVISPAAIARIVADEGAVLRHPEVFECDFSWREATLQRGTLRHELEFSNLATAFASVVKIEERRLQGSEDDAAELREIVQAARAEASMNSRSKITDAETREQLQEIAQWLTVWLQSPELFSDWLDLRRRSPDFLQKFEQ